MGYTPNTDIDGLQATLDTLRLGAVDSAGVAWFLQGLEGWDSPDVRAEFQERQSDHGAWASPAYYGARAITLTGTVEAQSRTALQGAVEQLYSAAPVTDTTLTVWESTPKQAIVRRSGKVLFQYVSDRTATWSVMVTAADPRRYSTTLQALTTHLPSTTGGLTLPAALPWTLSSTTVAGEISVTNAGTFETRPVFTITGPVASPQIICQMTDGSVRFLNYSQDLLTGDALVIDTDAHTVTLNGNVSRRRFLATPIGWPTIPAASTVACLFRASGYNSTATLTATWRSAWI